MGLLPRKLRLLLGPKKIILTFLVVASFFFIKSAYVKVRSSYSPRDLKTRSFEEVGVPRATGSAKEKQACVHPTLELWHPLLKGLFKNIPPLTCSKNEENWVYTNNGTICISKTAELKHGEITCECRPLKRIDDFKVVYGDTIKPLVNGTGLSFDFFEVSCVGKDGAKYNNLHSGIRHDPELLKPSDAGTPSTPYSNPLGYNIMMLGFDSTSRMSWQRNLPKTHKFLVETLGGSVLEGYNIVGDGTPQALLPILTGKTEWELPEARRGFPKASTLDGHPWIWNDFKKLGYMTQFGEDGGSVGAFNYRMLGFKKPPTDHFVRPFYLKAKPFKKAHCFGSVPEHLHLFNWVKDFFQMYPNKPKFSFVFSIQYSHDSNNNLKWADDDLKDLLEFLNVQGHLDNTVLVLMADHGARFRAGRLTVPGKHEERMPYFSFRFPPKFHKDFPEAVENFRTNTKRLTTPFDIHATFHDIVNFTGAGMGAVTNRGISLFKEIPRERTCKHADADPHWCACLNWKTESVGDKIVQRAVDLLLLTVNNVTRDYRSVCVELTLENITSAVSFTPGKDLLKFKKSADHDGRKADLSDKTEALETSYQITIMTKPNFGIFEATLKYLVKEDQLSSNIREISRLDRYGNQPHCVMDRFPHMRQFCYCKEQLP